MVEIEFDYLQIKTKIQVNMNDSFEIAAKKYVTKAQLDINKLSFLANGRVIKMNDIIENIMSQLEKQENKMKIIVVSINNTININNSNNDEASSAQIPLNEVICPICKEPCKLEMKNYKIKLFGCKNRHKTENIKLDEYMNYQNIDSSKIICDKCKIKNKSEIYNKEFYKCNNCNMKLCPLCKSIHDKTHIIINYDTRNIICQNHNKEYIKHCYDCQKDLCLDCAKEHEHSNFILFSDNLEYERNKINKLRKALNTFNVNIKEIIKKLNKIMENMEIFYNIYNNILCFAEHNKIHNIYQRYNLNDNFNSIIDCELEKIKNKCEYGNNIYELLALYNEMEDKNINIEMNYIPYVNYNQNNYNFNNKIRIFGHNFVENNKDKCKIIINNNIENEEREYKLTEYWEDLKNNINTQLTSIKFKIKGINNITNMSYMFDGCDQIQILPDISKWDTSKVTNISCMFAGCSLITSLPDISNWNISNVENMSGIFNSCCKLSNIPDISKWNTKNVINMNSLFNSCQSLLSLPDISKWNTSNVINMNYMFFGCKSLLSLPDIFKWDNSSLKVCKGMFYQCKSNLKINSKYNYI